MREISILKELQPHPNIVKYISFHAAWDKWFTHQHKKNW